MAKKINNDLLRLLGMKCRGMTKGAYRIHRELIAELEADHVALVAGA